MSTEDGSDNPIEDDAASDGNQVAEEANEQDKMTLQHMEQMEVAKLKNRYPAALKPGGTAFLQKRLNKGQKYFDSGDYNMAKAKCGKRMIPPVLAQPQQQLQQQQQQQQQQSPPTGEAIPTPDNLPTRKTSLVQSKLAAGLT